MHLQHPHGMDSPMTNDGQMDQMMNDRQIISKTLNMSRMFCFMQNM